MTRIELEYMNKVPNELHKLNQNLENINKNLNTLFITLINLLNQQNHDTRRND